MLKAVLMLMTVRTGIHVIASADIKRSLHAVEGSWVERCPQNGYGKSWIDDPVNLGIVGAESGLCATIH